ncbi:hypothetical protein SEA_YEEZY_64 [Gordonia phage Yeezy]|uniref:Uncharacterized protein n=1 Tax=Gordonia phage Yeezy TaxID=1821565 RepID=A0A142K9M6_9CAUD|nr:hypothetical protein SEA_YEEZY_64 [Gordonia phage Yeezy]AMS02809.1 hypothetical protein SEA_YEEZY_64 [Gordonia phage Yeezy]
MTDLVPSADIERIVGVPRDATKHLARAVSSTQTVYVLHSRGIRDTRLVPVQTLPDGQAGLEFGGAM